MLATRGNTVFFGLGRCSFGPPSTYVKTRLVDSCWCSPPAVCKTKLGIPSLLCCHTALRTCYCERQFHCVSLVWNWTAVVFGTALSCFRAVSAFHHLQASKKHSVVYAIFDIPTFWCRVRRIVSYIIIALPHESRKIRPASCEHLKVKSPKDFCQGTLHWTVFPKFYWRIKWRAPHANECHCVQNARKCHCVQNARRSRSLSLHWPTRPESTLATALKQLAAGSLHEVCFNIFNVTPTQHSNISNVLCASCFLTPRWPVSEGSRQWSTSSSASHCAAAWLGQMSKNSMRIR